MQDYVGKALGAEAKDDDDDPLELMNARFAVVNVGGKTRVVQLVESDIYPGCRVPVFSTFNDFRAFHSNRKHVVANKNGNVREIGLGQWWLDHPHRRQYERVVYAPNIDDANILNLWNGFACKPIQGDCGLYIDHLYDNVCGGNEDHAAYLLDWMAYAVQQPGLAGEVAVVLRGKEGTGKGVAAKEFGRLFGSHFRHVVHAKHLTGHFNAHLQQCSALFADEAFFAGDRSHESTLKALITEETLLVEPKGLDAYAVRNCIHLIMSSNADWVVPAGADARRYFVLNVSDAHMRDHDYFRAIVSQMDNGGREALLHRLLTRDIFNFQVQRVPVTDALSEQKAHTRRGVDQLVEHLAHDGILPWAHGANPRIAVTTGEDKGDGFYPAARRFAPDLKHKSAIIIARDLNEQWGCKSWHSGSQRGIEFPPLQKLRDLFDRRHGKQVWPPIEDWGTAP
jgi:hypothetical protein